MIRSQSIPRDVRPRHWPGGHRPAQNSGISESMNVGAKAFVAGCQPWATVRDRCRDEQGAKCAQNG
jgi:hypothetical protein